MLTQVYLLSDDLQYYAFMEALDIIMGEVVSK